MWGGGGGAKAPLPPPGSAHELRYPYGLCLGHTFPFLRAIVHDCHNPGETCLIRAHTLRDLDQRCEVVDERRGTGKSPDCFELFKTVVENRRSRHSGVEA